jgi:hypothetical protein
MAGWVEEKRQQDYISGTVFDFILQKRMTFAFLERISTSPWPFSFPRMARIGTDKNTFRFKQETRKPGFVYGFLASPLEAFYLCA